ncbi:MAG: hypothetical protein KA069_02060 [Candidatus Saccharimonas sp.]|nr:hypothetical protein [Candidatus Saccharimonas sp.]
MRRLIVYIQVILRVTAFAVFALLLEYFVELTSADFHSQLEHWFGPLTPWVLAIAGPILLLVSTIIPNVRDTLEKHSFTQTPPQPLYNNVYLKLSTIERGILVQSTKNLINRYFIQKNSGDLYNIRRINLLYSEIPLSIKQPVRLLDTSLATNVPKLPDDTTLLDCYQKAHGSLLVMGDNGIGKTTLLHELAGDLIRIVEQKPQHEEMIPWVFDLSSWNAQKTPLLEYLTTQLANHHSISRELAARALLGNEFTPILDSFDILSGDEIRQRVQQVNAFQQLRLAGRSLVVSSRLIPMVALMFEKVPDMVAAGQQAIMEGLIAMNENMINLGMGISINPATQLEVEKTIDSLGSDYAELKFLIYTQGEHEAVIGNPQLLYQMIESYKILEANKKASFTSNWTSTVSPNRFIGPFIEWNSNAFYAYYLYEALKNRRDGYYRVSQCYIWLEWLARHRRVTPTGDELPGYTIIHLQPKWLPSRFGKMLATWGFSLLCTTLLGALYWLLNKYLLDLFNISDALAMSEESRVLSWGYDYFWIIFGLPAAIFFTFRRTIWPEDRAYIKFNLSDLIKNRKEYWIKDLHQTRRLQKFLFVLFGISAILIYTMYYFGKLPPTTSERLRDTRTLVFTAIFVFLNIYIFLPVYTFAMNGIESRATLQIGDIKMKALITNTTNKILNLIIPFFTLYITPFILLFIISIIIEQSSGRPTTSYIFQYLFITSWIVILFFSALVVRFGYGQILQHFFIRLLIVLYRLGPWDYRRFFTMCTQYGIMYEYNGFYEFRTSKLREYFLSKDRTSYPFDYPDTT